MARKIDNPRRGRSPGPSILAVILAVCAWAGPPAGEIVRFKTADGWTIAALYHPPRKGKPVAVLVHGVAAGKDEWHKLSEALRGLGYGTLAIDLRGHGQSVKDGQRLTYPDFDRVGEWPRCVEDISAAIGFLKTKGIPANRVGLIGGSIGANLVSKAAAQEKRVRWAILLSPGRNYRGVGVDDLPGRKAVAAASPGDAYAHQTAVDLALRPGGPVFLEAKKGHGAQMIDDPEFLAKLLEWFRKNG
ncbi:MAG: alpha/beta fold hydrolase [Elusimicrobia bacterium]|nr:alpha/beta fold hydrolase [Elusimicrobiota bacterium]